MIKYYEYDERGSLIPVYEKDAKKFGKWIFKDGVMIRVSNEATAPLHYSSTDSLGVQGMKSQADGKMYDSKSSYRKSLKQSGYIEVGNEKPKERVQAGNYDCRADVAQAMKQLRIME